MKKIHLLRHAKSSWEAIHLDDIHRPLNKRGIRSCELMASAILEIGCGFTHVFSSPVVRAQSTIELLSKHMPDRHVNWHTDEQLYCFDSSGLHLWCAALDESISEVMIIGHNPAMTDFCNELSNVNIKNIPTCGYAKLTAHNEFKWPQVSVTLFELSCFLKPKELLEN